MSWIRPKIGLQARWPQTLFLFFLPLILFLSVRWIVIEPFVIPSESMVPNLFIHDHIVVNKLAYGVRWPMGDGWLMNWKFPQRGEVVVFRYPHNRNIFYIKRVVGLPGDRIKIQSNKLFVNDIEQPKKVVEEPTEKISLELESQSPSDYFEETFDENSKHFIRLSADQHLADYDNQEFTVEPNSYFVMGDNRNNSHDSRAWGSVDNKFIVGQAYLIWLSCRETLDSVPMLCDPKSVRSERIFKRVK